MRYGTGAIIKFRNDDDDYGVEWGVAELWYDGKYECELSRIRLSLFDGPGDEHYHAWVTVVGRAFDASLSRKIGLPVRGRRIAPRD